MVIGLGTDPKAQKHRKNLRNLFTFTIRSIVHRNKWTNFSGMNIEEISNRIVHRNKWTNFSGMNIEEISNQLTEKIKSEFKNTDDKQICHTYVEKTMKLTTL